MFKYISEILSQFSTPQKIVALSLLLFSIVTISIAPSLINAINLDKNELNGEIEKKDNKISNLEKQINESETKIRKEQQSCTNEILTREKEFISMLDYLKQKAKEESCQVRVVNESYAKTISNDTIVLTGVSPVVEKVIVKNDMKNIMKEIDLIKDKVHH
jgi:septal ring factor EnvC (AmiA/AmiB activator)